MLLMVEASMSWSKPMTSSAGNAVSVESGAGSSETITGGVAAPPGVSGSAPSAIHWRTKAMTSSGIGPPPSGMRSPTEALPSSLCTR